VASAQRRAQPLAELLPGLIRDLKKTSQPTRESIDRVWRGAAGKEAAGHSWATQLSRGKLVVDVENSGWMYLLNLKRPQLVERLKKSLGTDKIKELVFRMGEVRDAKG
jgi:hypothetical protein